MQLNRRKFIKYTGLLSGLAVFNPLRVLGLFKSKPILNMETMKAMDQGETLTWDISQDDYVYTAFKYPQWNRLSLDEKGVITKISHWNGKQWIQMED